MSILAILSFLASIVYINIGIYAYNIDKKSILNRIFFAMCLSMFIWSFGYGFVHSYSDPRSYNLWGQYIWQKISAIGWCSFNSLTLHLSLLMTENKIIENKKIKFLIYLPALIFFLTTTLFFWPNFTTPKFIEIFFYKGDLIYNLTFLFASIYVIYLWGRKSNNIRIKRQSAIICISSIIPYIFNLFSQMILPMYGVDTLVTAGNFYILITIIGVYYVIKVYRLFNISPDMLMNETLSEMMDLFILLSPDYKITKISKSMAELFKYSSEELLDKKLDTISIDEFFLNDIKVTDKPQVTHRYSEVECITKNGRMVPVSFSCTYIVDKRLKDLLGIVLVGHDITIMKKLQKEIEEHKEAEKMLIESQKQYEYLAFHDGLTGLPNRKYFNERLSIEINKAKRNFSVFAVFFIDLNGFKGVNDSYGHDIGDALLCEVAQRIQASIRKTDVAARIGGDEFLLLITDIKDYRDTDIVLNKIDTELSKKYYIEEHTISLKASIGISMYPDDGKTEDELINNSDKRMYFDKKHHKHNRICEGH